MLIIPSNPDARQNAVIIQVSAEDNEAIPPMAPVFATSKKNTSIRHDKTMIVTCDPNGNEFLGIAINGIPKASNSESKHKCHRRFTVMIRGQGSVLVSNGAKFWTEDHPNTTLMPISFSKDDSKEAKFVGYDDTCACEAVGASGNPDAIAYCTGDPNRDRFNCLTVVIA